MENSEVRQTPDPPVAGDTHVSPTAIEPAFRVDDESKRVHGHAGPSSIHVQCVEFMDSVKSKLGEDSNEWNIIYQTLKEFKFGRLSKRDAHINMVEALGENEDLKQGLVRVFLHQDALWGPEDFYQQPSEIAHQTPTGHTSPAFLQPQHEPQMRMPPMPIPWDPIQHALRQQSSPHLVNPTLLQSPFPQRDLQASMPSFHHQGPPEMRSNDYEGYEERGTYEGHPPHGIYHPAFVHNPYMHWNSFTPTGPSSPAPPPPSANPLLNQYAAPIIDHMHNVASYPGHLYGASFTSPVRHPAEQRSRSIPIYDGQEGDDPRANWEGFGSQHMLEHQYTEENQQACSPAVSNQEQTPQLASHLSSPHPTPPSLETPRVVPAGAAVLNRPALPKIASRHDSVAYTNAESRPEHDEQIQFHHESPAFTAVPSRLAQHPGDDQPKSPGRKTRAAPGSGPYIHAICGKGFMSRSSVKKHHWGSKTEDTSTTTGCWAKSGKPNRQWDEHDSCKQDPPKAKVTKTTQPAKGKQKTVSNKFKAAVAPSMIPNPDNTIPGFPTLHDLPSTVAQVVQSTPAFAGEPFACHVSQDSARGNFDSLLTAVNVASKIESPTPQGRNDSVVSNLDAQVASTERNRQNVMPWNNGQGFPYPNMVPEIQARVDTTAVGLGITHADGVRMPMDRVLTLEREEPVKNGVQGVKAEVEGHIDPSIIAEGEMAERRSHRGSTRRSGISKREQKMLGLSVSPEPEKA